MYKLTVIAGPNRGTSYAVQDGETSIGRQAGNGVVLPSSKVSKRHCVLVVNNEELTVKDEGSSNGTFVNGVLAKIRKLRPGDRISVGEYVMEVTKPLERTSGGVPALAGLGNVLEFPNRSNVPALGGASGLPGAPAMSNGMGNSMAPPKTIKDKAAAAFENDFMPIFYRLNLKYEWKLLLLGFIAIFVMATLIISVYPLLESNRATVIKEVGLRADLIAKIIADKNSAAMAARAETKTDIGAIIENEDGVRVAFLTDLDSRIIAPASKVNQYLTTGGVATLAVKASDAFKNGRETGLIFPVDELTIAAIEPVKILSNQAGRNVVVGMAVVALDTSLSTMDSGDMGIVYSETIIVLGLLGGLILLVVYRLTVKPFQVLNDDIDKVLKGEMNQVTHEFKFQELNALWDVINSALQRVPKSESLDGGDQIASGANWTEGAASLVKSIGEVAKFGLMLCDSERKIIYMNPIFEEISGLRFDNVVGQEMGDVARDQAMGSFTNDIFDRASTNSEGVSEDFEFSGVKFEIKASAVGQGSAKGFLMIAMRAEDA